MALRTHSKKTFLRWNWTIWEFVWLFLKDLERFGCSFLDGSSPQLGYKPLFKSKRTEPPVNLTTRKRQFKPRKDHLKTKTKTQKVF